MFARWERTHCWAILTGIVAFAAMMFVMWAFGICVWGEA